MTRVRRVQTYFRPGGDNPNGEDLNNADERENEEISANEADPAGWRPEWWIGGGAGKRVKHRIGVQNYKDDSASA